MKIIIFLIALLFSNKSFAYLDPGIGNIIIQSILGALAATITTISIYWSKIKNFIKKFRNNKNKKNNANK